MKPLTTVHTRAELLRQALRLPAIVGQRASRCAFPGCQRITLRHLCRDHRHNLATECGTPSRGIDDE